MSDFIELNDENFTENLASSKAALVDYYAGWCGACRMAAPMFRRVAEEFKLDLFKVDAEHNPLARAQVEIENLPTLALVKDGKIIASLCTTREESLRSFIQEHGLTT
jgi:thioredoxin 1